MPKNNLPSYEAGSNNKQPSPAPVISPTAGTPPPATVDIATATPGLAVPIPDTTAAPVVDPGTPSPDVFPSVDPTPAVDPLPAVDNSGSSNVGAVPAPVTASPTDLNTVATVAIPVPPVPGPGAAPQEYRLAREGAGGQQLVKGMILLEKYNRTLQMPKPSYCH